MKTETEIYEAATVDRWIYVKSPYHPRFSEYATAMGGEFIRPEKVWRFRRDRVTFGQVEACLQLCYGMNWKSCIGTISIALDLAALDEAGIQRLDSCGNSFHAKVHGDHWMVYADKDGGDDGKWYDLPPNCARAEFPVNAQDYFLTIKAQEVWAIHTTIIPGTLPDVPGMDPFTLGRHKLTGREHLMLNELAHLREDRRTAVLLALADTLR